MRPDAVHFWTRSSQIEQLLSLVDGVNQHGVGMRQQGMQLRFRCYDGDILQEG